MSVLSIVYALLFYVATAVLIVGVARKIRQYWVTPAPLKIPTTPAPVTQTGVVFRMAREVVLFESLFKSNKWIWIFGWMFHFALLLVLLRHLRYFQGDVWEVIVLLQPIGKYAAFAMLVGLLGLLARRIVVARVRYISAASDYLMLVLLLGIGISGSLMTFVGNADIIKIKAFFLGLLRFDIQTLPGDPLILVHLGLVALLMLVFPVSKLLHVPGVFFSPTRNQVDNPREKRHVVAWGDALRTDDFSKSE
ncbi:MAG: respiratory nitrate reductase subunit gamma [bacterium]